MKEGRAGENCSIVERGTYDGDVCFLRPHLTHVEASQSGGTWRILWLQNGRWSVQQRLVHAAVGPDKKGVGDASGVTQRADTGLGDCASRVEGGS